MQTGDFSVSLKAPGRNKHFRVHVESGMYCIGQRKFVSLQQLVDHYQVTSTFTALVCRSCSYNTHSYVSESTYLHISEGWKVIPNQATFKIIRIMIWWYANAICKLIYSCMDTGKSVFCFVRIHWNQVNIRLHIIFVSWTNYAWSKDRENLYLCRKL